MGLVDAHDKRKFEHLAKVDAKGVVVAMVELAEGSGWETWSDVEGNRYVYLTDLIPDHRNASLDVHGLRLLPPIVSAKSPKAVTMKKKKARR